MGLFLVLVLQQCVSLFQFAMGRNNQKSVWTQVGAQMIWDGNVDDENGHGEEWIENPLFITKYWAKLGIRK